MNKDEHDSAHVIPVPPPLVYAGPLLLGLVLSRRAPGLPLPNWLRRTAGGLLATCGVVTTALFFGSMRSANTTIIPNAPVSSLVVTGPFARTRNPGYLGMAAIYTGVALVANAVVPLLLLPGVLAIITRGVIEPEEQYLERRFGEIYRAYKGRVRRWL